MAAYNRADVLESVIARPMILRLYVARERDGFVEVAGSGYDAVRVTRADWEVAADGHSAKLLKRFAFAGGLMRKVLGYWFTRPDGDAVLWEGAFPDGGYDIIRAGDAIEVADTIKF